MTSSEVIPKWLLKMALMLKAPQQCFSSKAVTTLVTSLMGQKRHGSGSSGFCVTFPPYGSSPFTFLRS